MKRSALPKATVKDLEEDLYNEYSIRMFVRAPSTMRVATLYSEFMEKDFRPKNKLRRLASRIKSILGKGVEIEFVYPDGSLVTLNDRILIEEVLHE